MHVYYECGMCRMTLKKNLFEKDFKVSSLKFYLNNTESQKSQVSIRVTSKLKKWVTYRMWLSGLLLVLVIILNSVGI